MCFLSSRTYGFVTPFLVLLFLLFSCKSIEEKEREEEDKRIERYLSNHPETEFMQTEKGLYYHIMEEGNNNGVEDGDFIDLWVKNRILEQEMTDSFIDSNQYFIVGSNQVILGLNEGVKLISEEGMVRLIIPFDLAYNAPTSDYDVYHTYLTDIRLNEIIEDPEAWELERITNYVEKHYSDIEPDSSGFYYIETKQGEGAKIESGDQVSMKYEAKLIDGSHFDSRELFTFVIGQGEVIEGLKKGILNMYEGGEATIIIPSDLAYGSNYYHEVYPYATLIFDVKIYHQ